MSKRKLGILGVTPVILFASCWFAVNWNEQRNNTAWKNAETKTLQQPVYIPPTKESLLEAVNAERAKVGVKPLVVDPRIEASAQLKANDMVEKNYFGHIIPGTDKVLSPEMDRLLSSACVDSSENIYFGTKEYWSTTEAIKWWYNSHPHREAMLSNRSEITGFGIAGDKIVQHFCDIN